jgi:DNA-binding response OmpR family regulator
MAGEHIFVTEESRFIQEVCRSILEEHGFCVTCASNGLAAVNCPEIGDVDLFVVDDAMPGWDGFVTTKTVRQTLEITTTPVLLLIGEGDVSDRESVKLRGADGHLLKPFTPAQLLRKVTELLEEHRIEEEAQQRLSEVAGDRINQLAEEEVQTVIEKRTQIIVERMVQQVIETIDDRARREVDAKVNTLGAEREQELVRMTVTEVAHSMIDKQAEERVGEAIESQLTDRLEKAARRAADAVVPGIARERIRESLQSILDREVKIRVQQAVESLVPDASHKLVTAVDTLAQKIVPKVARDLIPELAERQIGLLSSKTIPQQIENQVRTQVSHHMREQIQPQVASATRKLWVRVIVFNSLVFAGIVAMLLWWFAKSGIPMPWEG